MKTRIKILEKYTSEKYFVYPTKKDLTKLRKSILKAMEEYARLKVAESESKKLKQARVSSNEAIQNENKKESEVAVCLLHDMKFIGDGQWICTKCKIVKTNNRQTDR